MLKGLVNDAKTKTASWVEISAAKCLGKKERKSCLAHISDNETFVQKKSIIIHFQYIFLTEVLDKKPRRDVFGFCVILSSLRSVLVGYVYEFQ